MSKRISYNRCWKLLIDKGMYRKDLQSAAKISTTTLAKMSKGENLQTDVLLKICTALNCGIEDILEVIDCESANI